MSRNFKITRWTTPRAYYIQNNSRADNFDATARISPTAGYIDVSIKMDVDSNTRLATTLESCGQANEPKTKIERKMASKS